MKPDDFEKQLEHQPMRQIPAEWRDEILDAARCESGPRHSTFKPRPLSWWRELFWPCPQAWAGLAAAWLLVFALNMATREPAQIVKTSKAVLMPEMLMALQERRRLLVELIGSPMAVEPPKPLDPRPRSEGLHEIAAT